ncbi:hypothetical protein D3C86_2021570 [compost metagenome]
MATVLADGRDANVRRCAAYRGRAQEAHQRADTRLATVFQRKHGPCIVGFVEYDTTRWRFGLEKNAFGDEGYEIAFNRNAE